MSWFLLEKSTGATDGFYTGSKDKAIEASKGLIEQYPNSSWALCEYKSGYVIGGESHFKTSHLHDKMNRELTSIYGNHWLKLKKQSVDVINFNATHTAFDVLTDYAFGGDKQAALEYLKTL